MSALIVTVSLPPAIERFRQAHVPTALQGVPAHVTLLYPFVATEAVDDEVRAAVARVAADHPPFEFRLEGVARWPTTVYLEVVPRAPFERLVDSLVAAFPAYPPYEGAYPYVPHVSLAEDDPDLSLDSIAADLEGLAALRQPATEIELIARLKGVWATTETFRLG